MATARTAADLNHDVEPFRQRFWPRLDELVEIAPFQKLHRDERQSILGVAETLQTCYNHLLVHGDDVGVLETRHGFRLALEPLAHPRIRDRRAAHDFDGYMSLEPWVVAVNKEHHPSSR